MGNLYPDIVEVLTNKGPKGDKGEPGDPGLPLATFEQARAGTSNATTISPYLLSAVLGENFPSLTPTGRPLLLWGWVETNTVVVCCDIANAPSSNVSLEVYSDAGLTTLLASSAPVATIATNGAGIAVYNTVQQLKVTGLPSDTPIWCALRVSGELWAVPVLERRTWPAVGANKSVRVAIGSCSKPADISAPDRVYDHIFVRGTALLLQTGDIDYSDKAVPDLGYARSRESRTIRSNSSFARMMRSVAVFHSPNDHDYAFNNNAWGLKTVYGYTAQEVGVQTRLAWQETFPHLNLAQEVLGETDKKKILIAHDPKIIGRLAILFPDWQSQKRRISVDGPAVIFGNGTNPPGSWDQDTWFYSKLSALDANANVNMIMLPVGPTWTGIPFDSLPKYHSIEQIKLCDAIKELSTKLVLEPGDSHQSALDNGPYSDYSSDGTMRVLQQVCSPLSNTELFYDAGPYFLNGVPAEVEGISSQVGELDWIDETPGSDPTYVARIYAAPFDPDTKLGTLKLEYASTNPAIGFEGKTTVIAALSQGVPVYKSGIGPTRKGGAGFTYALTAGGPGGTANVKPNKNIGWVPLTGLADGATGTMTLSAPQGCTIAGATSVNFTVKDYLPETVMYLNELAVMPNTARQVVINTFISGLKSAGLWDKFGLLHLHASNAAGDALVNVRRPRGLRQVAVGTPVFLQDRYNSGTGSATGYFDSGFTGGLGFDMEQGFAFCHIANDVDNANSVIGNGTMAINPRSSGSFRFRLQTATTYLVPNTVGNGTFLISRDGPTDPDGVNCWRGTTLLGHVSAPINPTGNLSQTTFLSGAWQSTDGFQYSSRQLGAWGLGRGGWTNTNVSDFNTILNAYLSAIGAS